MCRAQGWVQHRAAVDVGDAETIRDRREGEAKVLQAAAGRDVGESQCWVKRCPSDLPSRLPVRADQASGTVGLGAIDCGAVQHGIHRFVGVDGGEFGENANRHTLPGQRFSEGRLDGGSAIQAAEPALRGSAFAGAGVVKAVAERAIGKRH